MTDEGSTEDRGNFRVLGVKERYPSLWAAKTRRTARIRLMATGRTECVKICKVPSLCKRIEKELQRNTPRYRVSGS